MKDAGYMVMGGAIIVVIFVLGFVALLYAIVWPMNHLGLPSHLAQIEQLRADSQHVDPAQAEDVIGQVTVWNQTIRSNQSLNDQWWAAIVIPDEWDRVELIPVPR